VRCGVPEGAAVVLDVPVRGMAISDIVRPRTGSGLCLLVNECSFPEVLATTLAAAVLETTGMTASLRERSAKGSSSSRSDDGVYPEPDADENEEAALGDGGMGIDSGWSTDDDDEEYHELESVGL
jgi:hypothetical protein